MHKLSTFISCLSFPAEFTGRDRPRQLALNASTTEHHLRNVVFDTEYVLSLYVLFGTVVGPGIAATFRTCEFAPRGVVAVLLYAIHPGLRIPASGG